MENGDDAISASEFLSFLRKQTSTPASKKKLNQGSPASANLSAESKGDRDKTSVSGGKPTPVPHVNLGRQRRHRTHATSTLEPNLPRFHNGHDAGGLISPKKQSSPHKVNRRPSPTKVNTRGAPKARKSLLTIGSFVEAKNTSNKSASFNSSSFSTPSDYQSTPSSFAIASSADFPSLSAIDSKNVSTRRHRRRINPTRVSQDASVDPANGEDKNNMLATSDSLLPDGTVPPSGDQGRDMLKDYRSALGLGQGQANLKFSSSVNQDGDTVNTNGTDEVSLVDPLPDAFQDTSATIDTSFDKSTLEGHAEKYAQVLNGSACDTQIFRELHWLLRLLANNSDTASLPEDSVDADKLLTSAYSRRYFVCLVFQRCFWLWQVIDQFDAERLYTSPKLRPIFDGLGMQLSDVLTSDPLKNAAEKNFQRLSVGAHENSVDSRRDDFPNQPSFHAFKKQRDLFHELFNDWSNFAKTDPTTDFSEHFGNRARTLLRLGPHTINYVLCADLFISSFLDSKQMASNCASTSEDDFQSSRLDRLERRLSEISIVEETVEYGKRLKFYGNERFYKDFILHTDSYLFNTILQNRLVAEIEKQIAIYSQLVEDRTQIEPSVCLLDNADRLKKVGKLLGYVHFLPYQHSKLWTLEMQQMCEKSRNFGEFWLEQCQTADSAGFLDYILPCVVDFLAMAPMTSTESTLYRRLLGFLQAKLRHFNTDGTVKTNVIVRRMVIEWLFSLPSYQSASFDTVSVDGSNDYVVYNLEAIRRFCPWIGRLDKLYNQAISTAHSVKKIKPLQLSTSAVCESRAEFQKEDRIKLTVELDRHFFAHQPPVVKRCVQLCTETALNHMINETKSDIAVRVKDINPASVDVQNLSHFLVPATECIPGTEICRNPLAQLLASYGEISAEVLECAAVICHRTATERLRNWLATSATEWMLKEIEKSKSGDQLHVSDQAKSNIPVHSDGSVADFIQGLRERNIQLMTGQSLSKDELCDLNKQFEHLKPEIQTTLPSFVQVTVQNLMKQIQMNDEM